MSTTLVVGSVIAFAVIAALYFASRAGRAAAPDVLVLSQLRQAGSDLSKPHPIEFFLYFSTEDAAHRVKTQIATEGFSQTVTKSASGKLEWLLQANKTMVPKAEELARLREWFEKLATAENGSYDGWGTPVVR